MDKDIENNYFDELIETEGLDPGFYTWLKDMSKLNDRTSSFFVTLALEDFYVRMTQGPDFPEVKTIIKH
tara:strand:- start:665 stop:871 length:207 start_codon:yes stop_codon:yes gene_type:complete